MSSIFILDDDEDILFVLNYWLLNAGYEVHVFTNLKDMLLLFNTCLPDIMLLDINLPGEDGREVCKMMKKELHYNKPILHVSANPYLFDNTSCYCADGIIAKPFDLEELTTIVGAFISKQCDI